MHTAALEACGIQCSYVRLHIRPEELTEAIPLLVKHNFIGVNLTIPHKAAVIPLLEEITPKARTLGVVNTVAIKNGVTFGHNTDGEGLARAIQSDFQTRLGDLHPLILGAGGGAGRAIAIQCLWEGCRRIVLVNRTRSKVDELAAELRELSLTLKQGPSPEIIALTFDDPQLEGHSKSASLILQCTSLGMKEGDPSPLPAEFLHKEHFVYDTIYSKHTQLLKDAETKGAKTAHGLSMLLHQGALAFQIWFPDQTAPVALMESALRNATRTTQL